MLVFLIYVAYLLLADYLQYSSYEQLSYSEVSSLLLPACKQLLLSNAMAAMECRAWGMLGIMGHVGHGVCWAWGMAWGMGRVGMAVLIALNANAGTSSFRFLWLILSLAMMAFAAYVVYLLLVDFFDYPSYDKLTSEYTSTLSLPAREFLPKVTRELSHL